MSSEFETGFWKSSEYGNLTLVKAVQKRPCLYNNTLPEYSNKDVTRAAWQEIANEVGFPEWRCRKRWKCLRSAYFREKSAQCRGERITPYYLDKSMGFLLPFTHSQPLLDKLTSLCQIGEKHEDCEISFEEQTIDQTQEESPNSTLEEEEDTLDANPEVEAAVAALADSGTDIGAEEVVSNVVESCEDKPVQEMVVFPSIKHCFSVAQPIASTTTYYPKQSNQNFPKTYEERRVSNVSDDYRNARKQFILSFMPEVDEMPESKFRLFKRGILHLIDDVKLIVD